MFQWQLPWSTPQLSSTVWAVISHFLCTTIDDTAAKPILIVLPVDFAVWIPGTTSVGAATWGAVVFNGIFCAHDQLIVRFRGI